MDTNELATIAAGLTPADICIEFLAHSVVEYSYTPTLSVEIEIDGARCVIKDSGRGLQMKPDEGDTLSHAERALTSPYPCLPADPEIESFLSEHVWSAHEPLGPGLANHACAWMKYESARGGESWSQEFRFGVPQGAPTRGQGVSHVGTTIWFEATGDISVDVVSDFVALLRARVPDLQVSLSVFQREEDHEASK